MWNEEIFLCYMYQYLRLCLYFLCLLRNNLHEEISSYIFFCVMSIVPILFLCSQCILTNNLYESVLCVRVPGDEELPSHEYRQNNVSEVDKQKTWMAVSVLRHTFSKADHNTPLRCVALHQAYQTRSQSIEVLMDVQCKCWQRQTNRRINVQHRGRPTDRQTDRFILFIFFNHKQKIAGDMTCETGKQMKGVERRRLLMIVAEPLASLCVLCKREATQISNFANILYILQCSRNHMTFCFEWIFPLPSWSRSTFS